MITICKTCNRIKKFEQWIDIPETIDLSRKSSLPINYVQCDDCRLDLLRCRKAQYLENKLNKLAIALILTIIFIACKDLFFWFSKGGNL